MRTAMSMPTDPDSLLFLLQSGDALFPTGAYAHSFGLEGLTEFGVVRDAESLGAYLSQSLIPSVFAADVPLLAAAHAAAGAGEVARLCELDEMAGALKGTRELREASRRTGSQRLAVVEALTPSPLWPVLTAARAAGRWQGHAPVAFGVVCAVRGVAVVDAATAYTYQAAAGAVSAALKLLRLGQNAGQRVLQAALPAIAAGVPAAVARPAEEAGWFAPLVDVASARHETAYTRLFIS